MHFYNKIVRFGWCDFRVSPLQKIVWISSPKFTDTDEDANGPFNYGAAIILDEVVQNECQIIVIGHVECEVGLKIRFHLQHVW